MNIRPRYSQNVSLQPQKLQIQKIQKNILHLFIWKNLNNMGNMGVVGALSVAQNKSPETLDILESLKILNFVCQALKHVTQM